MCKYWLQLCERCFTPRRGGYSSPNRNVTDGTCGHKKLSEHYALYPTLYWHERKRNRRLDGALLHNQVPNDVELHLRIWLTPGCKNCLGKKEVYTEEGKIETVQNAALVNAGTDEEEAELHEADFAYLQAKRVMCIFLEEYPTIQGALPGEFRKWQAWKKANPDPVLEQFHKWILKEDDDDGPTPRAKPQITGLPAGTLDLPLGSKDKATFNDPFAYLVGSWDEDAISEDARSLSLEYESDSSVPSEAVYYDSESNKENSN
ncbi:hypothetical protein UCRPA7_5708 [Phaeoacremonium minimum UCRPA7]|uniref:Uncharacterized protein n=1 Tax=Phaeoacremonium minimum (strain UCR-PA7) TaxID=1286976 RepID=R8BHI0_PHAM7|nr:hypothetical protein UCRPA7_5708 [Phaeoacremonium minimum UCRPA7]EON98768.1 hypothetical protein UCRPA7_5708 [Phaeoacremonium minimum UCRPA7]